MSLIKTGGGITDIRGGFGGVYFHRDKSGLHSAAKPRKIRRRSAAQNKQRNAFSKARAACLEVSPVGKPHGWLNRWVSYYTYKALNNLPFIFDAIVTGDPNPDCTVKYTLAGTYNDEDYYERTDSAWLIWYNSDNDEWYINTQLGVEGPVFWSRRTTIEGVYDGGEPGFGEPIVTLELSPPPTDYQIPHLQEPPE